ncbi:hypothetical protein VTG60DRAFT_973 [Thermothelomyces hinnuleus]
MSRLRRPRGYLRGKPIVKKAGCVMKGGMLGPCKAALLLGVARDRKFSAKCNFVSQRLICARRYIAVLKLLPHLSKSFQLCGPCLPLRIHYKLDYLTKLTLYVCTYSNIYTRGCLQVSPATQWFKVGIFCIHRLWFQHTEIRRRRPKCSAAFMRTLALAET